MKDNNKGILFWITGFSGSGKTQIAKKFILQSKKNMVLQSYSVEMILEEYLFSKATLIKKDMTLL